MDAILPRGKAALAYGAGTGGEYRDFEESGWRV